MKLNFKTCLLLIVWLSPACDRRPAIDRSLDHALCRGDTNYLTRYLDSNGDPNRTIQYLPFRHHAGPLLHLPIFFGQLNNVTLLLNRGARPDERDSSGYTPLLSAVGSIGNNVSEETQTNIVAALLRAGANPNLGDGTRYGDTPLIQAASFGNTNMIRILLRAGAQVNALNKWQASALHYAKNREVAQLLLAAGANPTNRSESGETPADSAYRMEYFDVYALLTNSAHKSRTSDLKNERKSDR